MTTAVLAPYRIAPGYGWTYLNSGTVRLRRTKGFEHGQIVVETRTPDGAWRLHGHHSMFATRPVKPANGLELVLSERPSEDLRGIDVQVDIAGETPPSDTFVVPLGPVHHGTEALVPGLGVYNAGNGSFYLELWRPDMGVTDAGVGSTGFGGWSKFVPLLSKDGWREIPLPYGPYSHARIRTSTAYNDAVELQLTVRA